MSAKWGARERDGTLLVGVGVVKGTGIVLWQLVWMGHSLGDVAHVERGEGCWLWGRTVELVLAVLDDRLEVFEDVKAAIPGGQDRLVELLLLLLLWDVVLKGHGEGEAEKGDEKVVEGSSEERGEKRGVGVLCERGEANVMRVAW